MNDWQAGFAYDDRWTEFGDPADRDAAIQHLTVARDAGAQHGTPVQEIDATLARLYAQRADECDHREQHGADLDLAIEHARAALSAPFPPEGLRLLLGLALWERSLLDQQLAHSSPDGHVEHARPDGHVEHARVHRDDSIVFLEQALGEIADGDDTWAIAVGALASARYNRYIDQWPGAGPQDPADLEAALSMLPGALEISPDPLAMAYLVLALADRLGESDQPADRDRLIVWCRRLLDREGSPSADENFAREILSSALLDRARAGGGTRAADLSEAVDRLEAAMALAPADDEERGFLLKELAHARWAALDGDESRYREVDEMTAAADKAWALLQDDDPDRAQIAGPARCSMCG
jgi:hypothetical protein